MNLALHLFGRAGVELHGIENVPTDAQIGILLFCLLVLLAAALRWLVFDD